MKRLNKTENNVPVSLQGDCERPVGHRVKQPPSSSSHPFLPAAYSRISKGGERGLGLKSLDSWGFGAEPTAAGG